ncbi:MAG TPA: hypothetical protein VK035_04460 [Kiloniellales bacterium]|nr:hypothetical protein [Kiloniellales bacterium]
MTEARKTFQLRYVGSRFQGARLPLDVLLDLPAFRDLVAAYAKDRWRKLNLHRQRLPKGFDRSISLDLVSIDEGSAMVRLEWRRALAQKMLPDFTDELEELVERSYGDLVALINGAGHDQFPAALSSEHLRALNKLGSGLRQDERIEFLSSEGSDGEIIYLDTIRRKKLITHVGETYEARFDGFGKLIGLHLDGHVDVSTIEHGVLRIPVDVTRVRDEFDGNIDSEVQFAVQIELDNSDRYRSVTNVHDIELIDAELLNNLQRCRDRLKELSELTPGWLDGAGEAITTAAAKAANDLLAKRPWFSGAYHLYPTASGGILFEFEMNNWDLSVEISPEGTFEIYGVEIDGSSELEAQPFKQLDDDFTKIFDDYTGR